MSGRAVVLRADAAHLPLRDESADLIVCSPPFWQLRSYTDGGEHYDGQIGSEPAPREYIANLVDCTREWVRVLKPSGSIFVELGDKYDSGTTAGRVNPGTVKDGQGQGWNQGTPRVSTGRPKCLLDLPARYSIACVDQLGLIKRANIVWCLSGGARVYARTTTGDRPVMLRDLVRAYRPEDTRLWNGRQWTRVLGWNRSPDRDGALELELRTGERIGCTPGHRWPTQRGVIRADEIRIGDTIQTTRLPEPDTPATPACLEDDDIGWFVGMYLAEGSHSEKTLQFAGHVSETARNARLARIAEAYHGSAGVYRTSENGITCNVSGAILLGIIGHYIGRGRTASSKRLRKAVWQRSDAFLRALVDGYLEGDGHYDAKNDRWRIRFAANDELAADLRTLAGRLGAKISLRRFAAVPGDSVPHPKGRSFPGWRGEWCWTRSAHWNAKQDGEVIAIRASRAREFYDVGVADDPHLFALASGVLTHNSHVNGLPESVTDRVRVAHSMVFHFVKQPRYFAAVDEIREPQQSLGERHNGRSGYAGASDGVARSFSTRALSPLGKLPGSVWDIPSAPLVIPDRIAHARCCGVRKRPGCEDGLDHYACVDAETEVLTRRGWLRHDELRPGDDIAGFDLDAGAARWTACHGVNVYDYDGDLVAVDKPRALSMRLTPNHRTIVHKYVGVHHRISGPFVIQADNLGSHHFIPRSAEWLDPDHGTKGIGRDLASLCGWIAAEGWYGTNTVCLSQSATANPAHVAEIDALLQRLSSSWDGPGQTRNVAPHRGRWRATVQADGIIRRQIFDTEDEARAAVAAWRQELGLDKTRRTERRRYYKRAGRTWTDVLWRLSPRLCAEIRRRLMPDKRLTWELANLPADEAPALLQAFISGDGHVRPDGRVAVFQARDNKVTMDVLQAIAVRLGYKTNLSLAGGRWALYLTAGGRPLTLRGAGGSHPPVAREHYKGIVWCPTTGTGTFIARRNGTVFITGNSFPPALVRKIILGWSPSGICTVCGEGRFPVSDRQRIDIRPGYAKTHNGQRDGIPQSGGTRWKTAGRTDVSITGYACKCVPYTDHPGTGETTRRRDYNPYPQGYRAQGTCKRAGEYERSGPWREYHFEGWTPPLGRPAVVVDPFGGTGTSALVASVLGRIGITVDRSMDYSRLAVWRTTDPGERARALGVPKPPGQIDGQGDLFDLAGEAV